jgi:ABC-type transport system substrate-binding protein
MLVVGTAVVLAVALGVGGAWHPLATAAARTSVNSLGPSAESLDPAIQSDAGSAQVVTQLFEGLTAVDSASRVEPALAESWQTLDGGKRVVFHLRPDLTFSDGSPLKASAVVSSWMRVLSPAHLSDLSPLLDEVAGARAYREGTGPASAVGIHVSGDSDIEVDMATSTTDFPAIASNPTLAVVPPDIDSNPAVLRQGTFVGSGGYVVSAITSTETTLTANPHYWAGTPAITTVHLLSSPSSNGEIADFQSGKLDYTPVTGGDATWIAYDQTLGPSLRLEPSPSVEYYGFNATKAPFNNVHVRRAFELGIDWKKIVTLMAVPDMVPATGMVPPGVPAYSTTDFGAVFDLAKAKSELSAAGFANGNGFPKVTLVTTGQDADAVERAVIRQLHDNLGVDISYQTLAWKAYTAQLKTDAPAFWEMDWVADYPGADDFLGMLLGTGQPNNYGRWSDKNFDGALATALSSTDPAAIQKAFDQAQSIVQDQAPVIPVDYIGGYSLVAKGLVGAIPNGVGLVRYAGMAWDG